MLTRWVGVPFILALLASLFLFATTAAGYSPVIAEVSLKQLPPEAAQTYALILRGGPYPYARDGVKFGNREGILPARPRGYYREYTVPTPGAHNRGARRFIVGADGEFYYTDDHYRSFRRVRE
jgi:ribonuclease T1